MLSGGAIGQWQLQRTGRRRDEVASGGASSRSQQVDREAALHE